MKGGPLVSAGIVGYVKKVKKNEMGDPLGTSGFVGFLDKVKNERGDPLDYVCLGPGFGLRCRWFQDCF